MRIRIKHRRGDWSKELPQYKELQPLVLMQWLFDAIGSTPGESEDYDLYDTVTHTKHSGVLTMLQLQKAYPTLYDEHVDMWD